MRCSLANITKCLNEREGDGQTSSTGGLHKNCIQHLVGKLQDKEPLE
jgi:hypothetical protein